MTAAPPMILRVSQHAVERTGDWVIVCPDSASTLKLAASLNDAEFEAWTPVEMIERRVRKGAKPEPVPAALMPGFVFVRADRLHEVIALSHSPSLIYQVWDSQLRRMVTRGHPYFRMFRPNRGEIRLVPDRQLVSIRELDWTARAKASAKVFKPGDRVRLFGAGFEGLRGEVLASRKSRSKVLIDGWREVDVPTWSLQPELDETGQVHVSGVQSEQASSAKAA